MNEILLHSTFFIKNGVKCAFYILIVKYPLFLCVWILYRYMDQKYIYIRSKMSSLLVWGHCIVQIFCSEMWPVEQCIGLSADIEPDYLHSWPGLMCKHARKYPGFNDGATCLLPSAHVWTYTLAQTCSENMIGELSWLSTDCGRMLEWNLRSGFI